jgi:hypothetical protein
VNSHGIWHNPAVEQAMFAAMRFWLNRGVAGFRLDSIPTLFEDPQLRVEPVVGGTNALGDPNLEHVYTDELPEVHAVVRRLRAMVDHYPGQRVLIGETYLPNTQELDKWYGGARHDELQLPMDMLVGFLNIAKVIATLLLTSKATALLYQGQQDRAAHYDSCQGRGRERPDRHYRLAERERAR